MTLCRALLVAGCLLALGAPPALAQSPVMTYLSWDRPDDMGFSFLKYFDCDTNEGADELILVIDPIDAGSVTAVHARIYLHWFGSVWPPPQPHLPGFWRLQPGACRAGAYSVSTDFSAERFRSLTDFEDRMQGRPAVTSFTYPVDPDSEFGALNIDIRFPEPIDLWSSKYLLVCRIAFPHVKAVGAGSCPGCCVAMEFTSSVGYSEPGRAWTWGADDANHTTSGVRLAPHDLYSCPTTPAPTRTWGELKALYR